MFISNYEKDRIRIQIQSLDQLVKEILERLSTLETMAAKPVKPVKPKKKVDPKKEEAAKLRRREYARMYAQRKKQEKLKADFNAVISSAPVVTMSS